jgi:N-acetylmuramoyl-L-alanine amidase
MWFNPFRQFPAATSQIAAALCLALASAWACATDVQGLRLYRAPDNTRLVFDLTGEVEHGVTLVPKTGDRPEQVIIDISNTSLGAQVAVPDIKGTSITKFQSEQRNDFDLHVVLDLGTDVTPKSFLLKPNSPYGYRLVIDLADKVAAAPEAEPVQTAEPSKPASGRDIVIVVDAGHGGEDPGASGPHGLHEKNITLKIAKELAAVIDQHTGYRAQLTRASDYFIPLQGRSKIAMDKKADLFVSIHADAFRDKTAHGASVFAWSQRGATSTMAKFLAEDENLSDLMGGAEPDQVDDVVAKVVADLSIDGNVSYSLAMGHDILNQLSRMTRLHRGHVEQAGFMVLKSVRVPSLLIETGFISNPEEATHLNSSDYEHQLAEAIFSGINKHFMRVPPPDTYIASLKGASPAFVASTSVASSGDMAGDAGSSAAGSADPVPSVAAVTQKPAAHKTVARPVIHVVRRGDNLSTIAGRYNVSIDAIKKANRLKKTKVLVGQRLKIPPDG